jgi:dephospho-CoA kinase
MKKEKVIIALAANIGAGKSYTSDYISEKNDVENIRYSQVLSEILKKINLENDRENLQNLSLSLRKTFGENILEKVVLKKIENSKKRIIILDGIRREEDFDLIKREYNFNLIFIDVNEDIRRERVISRTEKTDDQNNCKEHFVKKEQHNSETKKSLKNIANFILDNNGSFENLEKNIDKILEDILK